MLEKRWTHPCADIPAAQFFSMMYLHKESLRFLGYPSLRSGINNGPLFEKVNLTFEKGKMYAILGTSGSGKTTFLSLIAGLDTPKSGEILYEDTSLKKIGLREYLNR
jgi:ABC-type cobalamin/Fe3+-siderophores transport system ATPase subunit